MKLSKYPSHPAFQFEATKWQWTTFQSMYMNDIDILAHTNNWLVYTNNINDINRKLAGTITMITIAIIMITIINIT